MTANYTVGNGFTGAISYCAEKEHAQIIEVSNISLEISDRDKFFSVPDAAQQMRNQAKERPRVKKPVLHVSFSFNENEKISSENQLKAVHSGLKNVGIDLNKHQALIVKHNDTKNPHYHVVVNRVDLQGDLHKDHRLADRLQVSCDRVEKEMNLRKTEGRTVIYDPKQEKGFSYVEREKKTKSISKNPKQVAEKRILETYEGAKKTAIDIESLKKECLKNGVEINVSTNKNGIFGVSFKDESTKKAVKGSKLGIKAKELNQILPKNKELAEQRQREPERTEPTSNISEEILKYENCKKQYFVNTKNYNLMIDRQTDSLINRGRGDVSLGNRAELVELEIKYLKINERKIIELSNKKERLEELKKTPRKEESFWNGKKKNTEIRSFNESLNAEENRVRKSIEYDERGGKVDAEMELQEFSSDMKRTNERELRSRMIRDEKAIQENGKAKGFDIVKEMKVREITKQREQREINRGKSKNRGFRSL